MNKLPDLTAVKREEIKTYTIKGKEYTELEEPLRKLLGEVIKS